MYLLDTNTVSEPKRKRPDPNVAAWLHRVDQAALHLSVLTLGEIAAGIAKIAGPNPLQANELNRWLDATRLHFADRVIGIDAEIAETWGRISATRTLPVVDGLIAATALVRGMTLATRNIRDVRDTGVPVINPWDG